MFIKLLFIFKKSMGQTLGFLSLGLCIFSPLPGLSQEGLGQRNSQDGLGFLREALTPEEPFLEVYTRLSQEKALTLERQRNVLNHRYDLSDRSSAFISMSRGKPIQEGVRVRLSPNLTWEKLSEMTPAEIREKDLFPLGFLPLPHVNHPEGGMVFPQHHIDEVNRQEGRDLNRFDAAYDLPQHFLAEFPPAIFLTTRPDLGDVSQGELVTRMNFERLFEGILNVKQLEGLRLLVTPFAQQQFNATADRRSVEPHLGVSCLDCHANGHTNNSFHLVGDIRPQKFRNRIDTPSMRGLNVQRLFGSQRALKTVEDFTQFEQRGAYFDGDIDKAVRKGALHLDRATDVHHMSEFQSILDFPPAPKLDVYGRLIPALATSQELRGEEVFFGKGKCASCHTPPHYTDNLMHDLKVERFFKPTIINGMMADADGPIKTFPLRGIKESPPYFHDGRLLTLEDTVEFFNLILETKLSEQDKKDLVAFLRVL